MLTTSITEKKFSRKLIGCDPEEVHSFLEMVASEMAHIIRQKNKLQNILKEKEITLAEYKERDELLKSTIRNATKMSERLQSDSEREARLILSDARQRAANIVKDARESLDKEFQEVAQLRKIRMQFENSLKVLVSAHVNMIDQSRSLTPDPVSPKSIFNSALEDFESEIDPSLNSTPLV